MYKYIYKYINKYYIIMKNIYKFWAPLTIVYVNCNYYLQYRAVKWYVK